MQKVLFPTAVVLGVAIAYIDSRPNWNDAGITALALFATSAVCGALAPTRPWLWALAIGVWIPIFGNVLAGNFASLLVLVFPFAGAYAGKAGRKMLSAT
jgi:hypothetical protein